MRLKTGAPLIGRTSLFRAVLATCRRNDMARPAARTGGVTGAERPLLVTGNGLVARDFAG
ncbi:hypothetical protein [Streptomyces sp. Ncost-T10-10d]|uniref:hypothetical protein n=1 Tax=Streptomyces sp. Ncost-T10-10d TaxID=1839774 RepID=UPI00081D88D9|nr:hypothetical protein [Streptomyces sp. Ncost-T10-10d]SCF57796.1 hypothetical protein GA0115254_104317 [Streptomyces sp. Ncost-T10-10d]